MGFLLEIICLIVLPDMKSSSLLEAWHTDMIHLQPWHIVAPKHLIPLVNKIQLLSIKLLKKKGRGNSFVCESHSGNESTESAGSKVASNLERGKYPVPLIEVESEVIHRMVSFTFLPWKVPAVHFHILSLHLKDRKSSKQGRSLT